MKKVAKLIRVTSVLSYVESAWKEYWWRSVGFEAADKISKESAEFGTSVHKLIETALTHSNTAFDVSPESACAYKVIQFIYENQITPLIGTWEDSLEIEVKDTKL